jgi:hypothetical protein
MCMHAWPPPPPSLHLPCSMCVMQTFSFPSFQRSRNKCICCEAGRRGQHEMWTCSRASQTATFSGYGSSDDTSNITRSVVKQRLTICMAACSSSFATIFPATTSRHPSARCIYSDHIADCPAVYLLAVVPPQLDLSATTAKFMKSTADPEQNHNCVGVLAAGVSC